MSRGLDRTPGISDRGVVSYPLKTSVAGKHHITPAIRYGLVRSQLHDKSCEGHVGSRLQRCITFPLQRSLRHCASTPHKLLKMWRLVSSILKSASIPPLENLASALLSYNNSSSIPHLWPQGGDLIRLLKGGGESMNEQRAVTTWIPICCVCHQVRDDRQSHDCPTQNGFDAWMSLRSFLRHYRVTRGTYQLTHTYCLHCMERLGLDQPQPGKRIGHPQSKPSRKRSDRVSSAPSARRMSAT